MRIEISVAGAPIPGSQPIPADTAVRESKGWTGTTHLPQQPEYVRGGLNLRGVIVPIVDLRCRFGRGGNEQ